MARLEYYLVSESASVDQLTNRVSIFNVIEEGKSKDFPKPLPTCVAVVLWEAEAGDLNRDFQAAIVITVPGGAEAARLPMNFTMTKPRQRLIAQIQGVVVPEPGYVNFELTLDGRHMANHRIDVARSDS